MALDRVLLGVVVDINDPTRTGRARIRIKGIFDDIPDEDLPWATQASVVSFGSKEGGGFLSVPKIGSLVSVEFDDGNYYTPFYSATWETDPTLVDAFKRSENGESYFGAHSLIYDTDAKPGPLKVIYQSDIGMLIELDKTKFHLKYDGKNITVVIKNGDNEITMDGSKVVVNSKNIELGIDAVESLVKGDTFMTFFNTHVHATPAGPSAPPTVPMTEAQLSQVSKTL